MTAIVLEAQARDDIGKGASRRLRRLENKVPGVIYGGNQAPVLITLEHHKLIRALEDEGTYSSVLIIKIKNKTEHVVLKDLQRHPYKPVVLHLDLQRVNDKDVIVKNVPIHFINEDKAPGIKQGGILNHTMTQLEIRCQVKDLPPFIEVDVANLGLDEVIHLSQVTLPKRVELAAEITDSNHDFSVVSIHLPKAAKESTSEEASEEAATEVNEDTDSTSA